MSVEVQEVQEVQEMMQGIVYAHRAATRFPASLPTPAPRHEGRWMTKEQSVQRPECATPMAKAQAGEKERRGQAWRMRFLMRNQVWQAL